MMQFTCLSKLETSYRIINISYLSSVSSVSTLVMTGYRTDNWGSITGEKFSFYHHVHIDPGTRIALCLILIP
jgi:hypothetical protein